MSYSKRRNSQSEITRTSLDDTEESTVIISSVLREPNASLRSALRGSLHRQETWVYQVNRRWEL